MSSFTAIVDYEVGNLKSVTNAMHYLGLSCQITSDPYVLEQADSILLPGVGAFPDAIKRLQMTGLDKILKSQADKKPILGICLGMQLLFDRGEEVRSCSGLGFIPGSIQRIQTTNKLPHVGWNSLTFPKPSPLFHGIDSGSYVYFVHSFCGMTQAFEDVIAETEYSVAIIAAVQHGNIYGCQFHPEKSGEIGLQILKNFGELNR